MTRLPEWVEESMPRSKALKPILDLEKSPIGLVPGEVIRLQVHKVRSMKIQGFFELNLLFEPLFYQVNKKKPRRLAGFRKVWLFGPQKCEYEISYSNFG
jgi:hypothetical protein